MHTYIIIYWGVGGGVEDKDKWEHSLLVWKEGENTVIVM